MLKNKMARGAALVAVLGLAACGGGGGDGDGNAPVVDGKDKAAVANQGLVAVQLAILSEDFFDGATVATAQAKATTTSTCSGGGSIEDTDTSGQPGDVPFPAAANLSYSIHGQTFRNCVISEDTNTFPDPDGSGPQTGSTISTRTVLNGVVREGDAEDSSNFYDFAIWGSGSTPQRTTMDIHVVQNGQASDVRLTLDSLLRSDSRDYSGGFETLLFGIFDFGVQGQVAGQRAGISGDIRVGAGLDQRLRIVDSEGVRIDGQYRIALDEICQATVDLSTVTPITFDESSETTGGELLVTVNGVRSTVSYGSAGSITVTQGGSSQTFDREDLLMQQATAPCSFAALGPFMASTF